MLSHATLSHATLSRAMLSHATLSHAMLSHVCGMSQPLTVAHRSGQLAYPTWAAHTTHCPDLLVDEACRCEGSGQAGQGMRGPLLYL